jgi:hypothetical protein
MVFSVLSLHTCPGKLWNLSLLSALLAIPWYPDFGLRISEFTWYVADG